jgi:cytochrome c553
MKNAAAVNAAALPTTAARTTVAGATRATVLRRASNGLALAAGAAVLALGLTGSALAQARGDARNGAQLSAMCAGCHGINGLRNAYPEVYRIPKIGGQHPDYIVAALQGYRSGERNHPTMRAIASSLTDQAMADLAAFYSQGGLRAAAAGK